MNGLLSRPGSVSGTNSNRTWAVADHISYVDADTIGSQSLNAGRAVVHFAVGIERHPSGHNAIFWKTQ